MNFKDYEIALITDEKQRMYFLGFHSTAGYVILTKEKTYFVVDNRYLKAAEKALKSKGIEVALGSDYSFLKNLAAEKGFKKVAIDFGVVSLAEFENLKKLGFEYVDASAEIRDVMSVKTDEEIKYIQKACNIAEKAWRDTLLFIKEGVTERQVANVLEFNFKKYGASGTSFDTIVAFGKNAAVPHHATGDTKLKNNECVLMDFGCVYKGYCSDMTRTMFYGTPDEKFRMAYLAVLSAHMKAAEGIKEGMTGKEADKIARDVLETLGYGKYFTHSLGHGIGVNIHEYPYLSPKGEAVLKNNMVFSNEPGVYLNGKFGIRIEDSCHLENGKYKTFMKDDKSLIILGGDGTIKREKLYR